MLDERERCSVEDSTSKMTACLSEDEGPEDEIATWIGAMKIRTALEGARN